MMALFIRIDSGIEENIA